jgi:uncharacterized membrane protein
VSDKRIRYLTQGAVIAAIYVVLCQIFAPISFRDVQVRIAEGLTILPFFTPAAVPGLFVGCLLGNLLAGPIPLDISFGSLATLIGAVGTWAIGKWICKKHPDSRRIKYLLPVPPIVSNTIIIPLILYYGYGINIPIPIQMATVGLGEILSCGVIGMLFLFALEKVSGKIFYPQEN